MAARYASKSAFGAAVLVSWNFFNHNVLERELWIENDYMQILWGLSKSFGELVLAGYVLFSYPYSLFPAIVATLSSRLGEEDYDMVQVTIGGFDNERRGGGSDGEKGQWT